MATPVIHPDAKTMIDRAALSTEPPLETLSPAEARRTADLRVMNAPLAKSPVAEVLDIEIAGPAGPLKLRLYRPNSGRSAPLCMFFHGGGFMLGNLDTHDALCRALAVRSGAALLAVEFRLAPEHRFPSALDDCFAATRWALANAATLGVSATRFALAGESSGGNLAAGVALRLREEGITPALQLLLYPLVDMQLEGQSYQQFAEGFLLTARRMAHYIGNYLRSPADIANPLASPLRDPQPALSPPTFLLTAGLDLTFGQAQRYGERLRSAGVAVESAHFEGWPHGFLFWGHAEGSTRAINAAGDALARALAS